MKLIISNNVLFIVLDQPPPLSLSLSATGSTYVLVTQ